MFSIPKFAMIVGGLDGAGFDVDVIGEQVIGVVEGTTDAAAIPGQVISESVDVARNLKNDPIGTNMNIAMGVAVPYGMAKLTGTVLSALGVPTTVYGVQYAIPPKKKTRRRIKRAVRRARRAVTKSAPRRKTTTKKRK